MCGGLCNSINCCRKRQDTESRDSEIIYFEVCMLIIELKNSLKQEDHAKIIDELHSFIDIYFRHMQK
jgi:hypothetical protein